MILSGEREVGGSQRPKREGGRVWSWAMGCARAISEINGDSSSVAACGEEVDTFRLSLAASTDVASPSRQVPRPKMEI